MHGASYAEVMTTSALTVPSLVVPSTGDSSVLRIEQREVPAPGPGQVRVKVAATGVNFIEIYQREGVYPMPLPFVLGDEGAGRVESVGEGVEEFAVGDAVAWAQGPGSAAGAVVVDAAKVVAVPAQVGLVTAAASMLQGLTAHYLVTTTYAVQRGDTALVHAVAGGVGQLLVQLLKAKGATVIGTAGTPEKVEIGRALGADHVIDYSTFTEAQELADEIKALAGGGVAVAYDGVGKATFDASLASLRPRGLLVLFGAASGQVPPFDIQRLNRGGSLYLTRPTLADHLTTPEELRWRSGELFAAIGDGTLQVSIGGEYPLEEAGRAYDDLAGRRSTGKLLLVP